MLRMPFINLVSIDGVTRKVATNTCPDKVGTIVLYHDNPFVDMYTTPFSEWKAALCVGPMRDTQEPVYILHPMTMNEDSIGALWRAYFVWGI